MLPQLKDVVTRYRPDIPWADDEWLEPASFWRSLDPLAWLFNDSSARDAVINDRWGSDCRHRHGGYYTTEFAPGMADGRHPWEENRTVSRPRAYDDEGRRLWYEWVHDRQLTHSDYYSPHELVLTLVDTVSRGGNLLLNVGPTAVGLIRRVAERCGIDDDLGVKGQSGIL